MTICIGKWAAPSQGIRQGNWRAVKNKAAWELYDLSTDPAEIENLAAITLTLSPNSKPSPPPPACLRWKARFPARTGMSATAAPRPANRTIPTHRDPLTGAKKFPKTAAMPTERNAVESGLETGSFQQRERGKQKLGL